MKISAAIIFTLLIVLSGCSNQQSAQEICQETNNILKKKQGRGFTDQAMANCIRLGAVEAKRQQEVVKTW